MIVYASIGSFKQELHEFLAVSERTIWKGIIDALDPELRNSMAPKKQRSF